MSLSKQESFDEFINVWKNDDDDLFSEYWIKRIFLLCDNAEWDLDNPLRKEKIYIIKKLNCETCEVNCSEYENLEKLRRLWNEYQLKKKQNI